MTAPRVLYICNAFSDEVRREREVATDSPAATAKVAGVCRAVRRAGGKIGIVSLGRGRCRNTRRSWRGRNGRLRGVAVAYLPFVDLPLITHLATMFSLCAALWRLSRRGSILLFYNPQAHYLPALILFRLLGRRCLLDLEDGFRGDERRLRRTVQGALYRSFDLCCREGAIVASEGLKAQSSARRHLVCYGVASPPRPVPPWPERRVQVLFGGSLLEDTGALLFLRALDLLMERSPQTLSALRFVVTGFGDCAAEIRRAADGRMASFLSFYGKVSCGEYERIVHDSQVGLCLKLPATSMGSTTFPSKVVEIASRGLLLVSTRVSDVELLFDDRSALLLPQATPEALAAALERVAGDPVLARELAVAGQRRVGARLSEEEVGRQLVSFWQGGEIPASAAT